MKCPKCPDLFLSMSERNGIEIDYCPQCRGIWLDRGELDKLLEKAKDENISSSIRHESTPSSPYNYSHSKEDEHNYKKHDYHHGKRKKNFWEEIFD
ncbi:MAG: zf-TFIIB domain-containing protein [Oligoflexia bacterium]|nr:zf-TFIIB domain-containing protein [Oligoflexia bacterium]